MRGLHLTVTARRTATQQPVVESYEFLPYVDNVHPPDSLQKYAAKCSGYAYNGLKKFLEKTKETELPNRDVIEKALLTTSPDVAMSAEEAEQAAQHTGGLLQVLCRLLKLTYSESFGKNVTNIIQSFQADLQTDKVLQCLCDASILNPCVDIWVENRITSNLRILEMQGSGNSNYLCDKIMSHLFNQSSLQVHYTVAGLSSEKSSPPSIQSDIEMDTVEWDPSRQPPDKFLPVHLAVANNVLHSQVDISAALGNISDMLQDDGFLLVIEATTNVHVYLPLEVFVNKIPEIQDGQCRTWGPYCNEDAWLKLFEKGGFEMVFKRSDGLLSTLFLLRKMKPQSKGHPTILPVSGLTCTWVSELKTKFFSLSKVKEDKLWLVTDSTPYSGIVGLVNCLRQEPGGEQLRYMHYIG